MVPKPAVKGAKWHKREADTRLNGRRTLGGERAAEASCRAQNGRKTMHMTFGARWCWGRMDAPLRGAEGAQQGSGYIKNRRNIQKLFV